MKQVTYTYKSKPTAIVLGLLLGGLGIHRAYLGHIMPMLGLLLLTCLLALTPLWWVSTLVVLFDILWIGTQDREYFKRESGYTEISEATQ